MAERNRFTFRGSNAAEAEDFIQAVRRKAWAEQKQFDYGWMAAFAATQMSGPALWWHASLPRDVQSDWGKLELALLDKFGPSQPPPPPSSSSVVPSGALANPAPCTGRIRVTDSNTGRFVGYISNNVAKKGGYAVSFTMKLDEALVIQFTPSSSLVTFDLADKSDFHRLAFRKVDELEIAGDGQIDLSLICFAPGPKPGSIRYSWNYGPGLPCHIQHAVWKMDADGCITPSWPPSPQITIGAVIDSPLVQPGVNVWLVPPIAQLRFWADPDRRLKDEVWRKDHSRARLEFEPA